MTDQIDWAIEAAANVTNENGGPWDAVLVALDGSVLGRAVVRHGSPSVCFEVLKTAKPSHVEFDGKVFNVEPQCLCRCQTITYQMFWP